MEAWYSDFVLPYPPAAPSGGGGGGGGGTGNTLTTLGLTSSVGGSNLPSVFGVALPEGATLGPVSTNETESYCVTMRTWEDGSVKHVAVITRPNLTINVLKSLLILDSPSTSGTNLTSSDIAANSTLTTTTQNIANLGVKGTVDLATLLGSPKRTIISCPQMVECEYESVINNIFVGFNVRLFKGGRIRIVITVDTGWIDLTNADAVYVATLKVGGTTLYSNTFTSGVPHYQNSGYTAEGWIGGDPGILPKHNMPDLINTGLVPNYFMDTPTSGGLNALTQTYTPFAFGDWTQTMGDTGYAPQIGLIPNWDALCVTSLGDPRAFKSCLANAKLLRSYGIIWRGSSDGNLPARASVYPSDSLFGGTDQVNTGSLVWDINHHGSGGYIAYLLTCDRQYLDTMKLQSATCYFCNNPAQYGVGLSRYLGRQIRGHGWQMRTLGQMAAICPTGDSMLNDTRAILDNIAVTDLAAFNSVGFPNLGIAYSAYNGGGNGRGSGWNRPDGAVYPPGTGSGLDGQLNTDGTISAWMQEFVVQTMGFLSDAKHGTASQMVTWAQSRDKHYVWTVGMLGTGSTTPVTGSYCFSFSSQYGLLVDHPTLPAFGDDVIPNWHATDWGTLFADAGNTPAGYSSCVNTLQGTGAATITGTLSLGAGLTGYGWGNRQPAIAYAVDHGAVGAQAAYNRLLGASNYTTLRFNTGGTGNIGDFPVWCIQPRDALQALLGTMSPGEWKAAPSTNMSAVQYSGPAAGTLLGSNGPSAVMEDWSGAVIDTNQDQLIVWGGGHGNYFGNEVYTFSLKKLAWAELTLPDPDYPAVYPGNAGGLTSAGNPVSRHTYDNLAFLPIQNKFFALHGNDKNSNGDDNTWTLDPLTQNPAALGAWVRHDSAPGSNVGGSGVFPGSNCAYDPTSAHVFYVGDDLFGIDEWDPTASPGSQWSITNGNSQQLPAQQMRCAIKPGDLMIVIGIGFTVSVGISGANKGVLTILTTTGAAGKAAIENGEGPGVVWHPPSNKFVCWNGGLNLYTFDPVTNVYAQITGTANVSPSTGFNTPTATQPNGTYGRFQYDARRNCFIAVNATNENVYVWKPTI